MTVLDADLRNYYLRTFGFYTTIKMPLTMTGEKYWEVLHTGPQESPQDAPFESANNVVWIASSGKWAIWGERGYCICILGFAENNIPKVPYGRGWWRPASEALEQLIDNNFKEHTAPQEFADTFLGNYFNK